VGGKVGIVADRVGWEERQLINCGDSCGLQFEWVNDESLCLGDPRAKSLSGYDIVLIRSRSYTRGGLLATMTAASKIPVLNTPEVISACENKLAMRALLLGAGVESPDFRLVVSRKDFQLALAEFPLPIVLKPVFGGMGRRVILLRGSEAAQSLYDYIEDLGHAFEQACLVEPYLGSRSVRCLVVGRELVAAAEFESNGTDWRSNAATGSRQRAIVHEPEIHQIVDDVVNELGEGVYGIDLFRTRSGYVVNEVNHAPGFRAVATATGVDVATLIGQHVRDLLR
jgi:[lysine-biosynthesis-protein LysW]---L-2-aminoadipate ligase